MSTTSRREYHREYSKKYYKDNKDEINERKKITNAKRQKTIAMIYKYWKQGKLIPCDDIIKEEIQKTNTEIKDIWTNTDEELLQELSSSPKTLKEADKLLDIKNKLTKA